MSNGTGPKRQVRWAKLTGMSESDFEAAGIATGGTALGLPNVRISRDQLARQAFEGRRIVLAAGCCRVVAAAQWAVLEEQCDVAAQRPAEAAGAGKGPGMGADGLGKDIGRQPPGQALQYCLNRLRNAVGQQIIRGPQPREPGHAGGALEAKSIAKLQVKRFHLCLRNHLAWRCDGMRTIACGIEQPEGHGLAFDSIERFGKPDDGVGSDPACLRHPGHWTDSSICSVPPPQAMASAAC